MFFESFEFLKSFDRHQVTIDEQSCVTFTLRPLGDIGVESFARLDDRSQDENFSFGCRFPDAGENGGDGLFGDGFPAIGRMLDPGFGEEQAKEMVNLRDRGNGGFSSTTGNALFDGDGRRQSGYVIDVGSFQLFDKLAGIG